MSATWSERHPDEQEPVTEITVVHVLRTGEPVCPTCKQGLESEGGTVTRGGSWDYGPLYWRCIECDEQWGHA